MKAWGLAPISIWALKGATKYKRHDIVKSLDAEAIGPLRGPIRFLLAFPRPHEVSDLCALGLPQVKAAGLVQASWPAKLSPDNNNYLITEQSELSENIGLRLSLFYMNYHECII